MQRPLCDPCFKSLCYVRTADSRVLSGVKRTVRDGHSAKGNHRCQAASAVQTATESPETEFKIAAEEMPAPRGGYLKEEATAYVEEHRIRAYEADPNQRTTIVTMSNLLQASFLLSKAVQSTRLLQPGSLLSRQELLSSFPPLEEASGRFVPSQSLHFEMLGSGYVRQIVVCESASCGKHTLVCSRRSATKIRRSVC